MEIFKDVLKEYTFSEATKIKLDTFLNCLQKEIVREQAEELTGLDGIMNSVFLKDCLNSVK